MVVSLTEGVCLSGRFRLERCIGEGGMGLVWAATNTNTFRRVALKFLRAEGASDPRVRRRFLREARAASAVRHPNVVEILDVLELEDGSPAIVMELLEGEPLSQRLRREGRLEVGEAASILLPVVAAVGAAHAAGVVHRDLKPDNIFLARGPNGETVVKVVDFGIAKVSALDHEAGHTEALTGTGTMLGTPYYMSPEQVFADAVIDYRSDIWALGVIFYQCLAGVRPTQAENVGQIMKIIMSGSIVPLAHVAPDLPPTLAELVGRMLSSDREARPQSLKYVCDVLRMHTDVMVGTFGDPVLVNVVAAPDASSGKLVRTPVADSVAEPTRTDTPDLPATRSEGKPKPRGRTRARHGRTDRDELLAPPAIAEGDVEWDSMHTERSLGVSMSSRRPAMPRQWSRYAPIGAFALMTIAVVSLAAKVLQTPSASSLLAAPPVDSRSGAIEIVTAEVRASSPAARLENDAGSVATAVASPVESVNADRGSRPGARRTTGTREPSAPPRTSVSTNAPAPTGRSPEPAAAGGLVEKPPF